MPGKPGQSKLAPFEGEIIDLLLEGVSYRRIADVLKKRHGLVLSHNAVYSYVTAKTRRHRFRHTFLSGLDRDLREALMQQLVAEWTHDSTALEGNTLTLGETLRVLELGLTVSGKPVKDHEEVRGHAKAIDLLQGLIEVKKIDKEALFDLHRAVMPHVAMDAYNPVGDWKREPNGATGVVDGRTFYMEYASPADTPALMDRWLEEFNSRLNRTGRGTRALDAYLWSHTSFVRIHPFFDGNGRMARLLANLPVLRGGHPPLTISVEDRLEYIELLWDYQRRAGRLERENDLLPESPLLTRIREFMEIQWTRVTRLVDETRAKQRARG